jgi:hypothetical protein
MLSRLAGRVTALLALVVATLVVLAPNGFAAGGGSGGETITVAVPGTVTCATSDGTALGTNPTLHRGDRIVCTVSGLGPSEMVDVTLDPSTGNGGTDLGTITMNAQGGATFDFTVAANAAAGAHTLSFTGEKSKGVATFPFTVTISPGNGNGNGNNGGNNGGNGGGNSGGLAFTGAYVLGPLTAAGVLIGGGTLLASTYRRRRRHG